MLGGLVVGSFFSPHVFWQENYSWGGSTGVVWQQTPEKDIIILNKIKPAADSSPRQKGGKAAGPRRWPHPTEARGPGSCAGQARGSLGAAAHLGVPLAPAGPRWARGRILGRAETPGLSTSAALDPVSPRSWCPRDGAGPRVRDHWPRAGSQPGAGPCSSAGTHSSAGPRARASPQASDPWSRAGPHPDPGAPIQGWSPSWSLSPGK